MAFAQIATSVTIINSGLIGYCGVSLTNFSTSAASLIASGSGVEVAGAFFKATGDVTPNASSLTAIATGATAFLTLTPSGTAGSQILSAAWTSVAPVWSPSKQGWYTSAASNIRVVARIYKHSTSGQSRKRMMGTAQGLDIAYRWRGEIVRLTSGSGSWTVPDDVYRIRVTCVGGGGGGGSGYDTYCAGGGGGTVISPAIGEFIDVVPGESIAYSVGAGGAGATATTGTIVVGGTGGNTTFTGATTGQGGAGGGLTGGDGGAGNAAAAGNCPGHSGGSGGGAGGKGGRGGSPNGSAGAYGGGGGGGYQNLIGSGAGGNGGDGGSGIILIEY